LGLCLLRVGPYLRFLRGVEAAEAARGWLAPLAPGPRMARLLEARRDRLVEVAEAALRLCLGLGLALAWGSLKTGQAQVEASELLRLAKETRLWAAEAAGLPMQWTSRRARKRALRGKAEIGFAWWSSSLSR